VELPVGEEGAGVGKGAFCLGVLFSELPKVGYAFSGPEPVCSPYAVSWLWSLFNECVLFSAASSSLCFSALVTARVRAGLW